MSGPTVAKIERDLDSVLRSAASSLESYETVSGVLPPLLPNPAIRGLVRYERQSDFGYRLTATLGNVTMAVGSSRRTPYRVGADSE